MTNGLPSKSSVSGSYKSPNTKRPGGVVNSIAVLLKCETPKLWWIAHLPRATLVHKGYDSSARAGLCYMLSDGVPPLSVGNDCGGSTIPIDAGVTGASGPAGTSCACLSLAAAGFGAPCISTCLIDQNEASSSALRAYSKGCEVSRTPSSFLCMRVCRYSCTEVNTAPTLEAAIWRSGVIVSGCDGVMS